jgi:hypothetical protein
MTNVVLAHGNTFAAIRRASLNSQVKSSHPRARIARGWSNLSVWTDLPRRFGGALMRRALAPQTKQPLGKPPSWINASPWCRSAAARSAKMYVVARTSIALWSGPFGPRRTTASDGLSDPSPSERVRPLGAIVQDIGPVSLVPTPIVAQPRHAPHKSFWLKRPSGVV